MGSSVFFWSSGSPFALAIEIRSSKGNTHPFWCLQFCSQTDHQGYHLQIWKPVPTTLRKGRQLRWMELYCATAQTDRAVQHGKALGTAGCRTGGVPPPRSQLPRAISVTECTTYLLSLFRLSVGCWYCPFILLSLLQHTQKNPVT